MTVIGRLDAQMAFLRQACALKSVSRANVLLDLSRPENSAEHSWHVALCALVLTPPGPVPDDATRDRAIAMLLVHDLVEIDAGDHPIHQAHDPAHIARIEAEAATRIFGLLPPDQCATLRALWDEFCDGTSPAARLAVAVDHLQPILQVLCAPRPLAAHLDIVAENLSSGRARWIAGEWPNMARCLDAFRLAQPLPDGPLAHQIAFLAQADALKSVNRATTLCDASRPENSAEHSWHLALYALVLGDHAPANTDINRVIRMLLLHDLVEIDAGDTPIYAQVDRAAVDRAEQAAATRLFGLLPADQGAALRALWDAFEVAQSPDARFGKALDRFQPPNQNLASGGVSWRNHDATLDQVESRVGRPIALGAPTLWDWIAPQIRAWFARPLA